MGIIDLLKRDRDKWINREFDLPFCEEADEVPPEEQDES